MQVIDMPISELREYENNPRLNDDAVEPVAKSIERFGFKVPCVIDGNNVIVTGHTRLKAARLLGMDTVPCIVADDLTEEQVRAFRITDNKVGEIAQWDMDALKIELGEIELDMDGFGFIDLDLDGIEDVSEDDFDVEEAIESASEPSVKRGQVWRLGDHYLMCGDSTDNEDVAKLMSAGGG